MARQSHALRFNGRSRVALQNTEGLADLSRSFTAEAWVRLSSHSPAPAHYVMGNGAMKGFHPEVTESGLAGWFLFGVLFLWQHRMISSDGLDAVNAAFFTANGALAVAICVLFLFAKMHPAL